MTTTTESFLKKLFATYPSGTPFTSRQLASLGISADLAVHYVRTGWLVRLARGMFARPLEPLVLHPSIRVLEQKLPGLHVGGKSALEWQGIRQYVSQQSTLYLYGWSAGALPEWFGTRFPSEYHRKRIFDEQAAALLSVSRFQGEDGAPLVSSPERAFLELLSDVGVRQTLAETREIAEGTHTLRHNLLIELLRKCTSVKTVRLCLTLGVELSLPWAARLDPKTLPTGSDKPWVASLGDETLFLKP